jgi:hypothetical protein
LTKMPATVLDKFNFHYLLKELLGDVLTRCTSCPRLKVNLHIVRYEVPYLLQSDQFVNSTELLRAAWGGGGGLVWNSSPAAMEEGALHTQNKQVRYRPQVLPK